MCLNNLGNAYLQKEDYIKAFDCHRRALNIPVKNLPSEHPDINITYRNISLLKE